MAIVVNARFMSRRVTGVERYARAIVSRLGGDVQLARPPLDGAAAGHLWEQAGLPAQVRTGDLLWSPANTGPLALRRQVVTIHDVSPLDHPEWFHPRFAAWYRLLVPRLARRVQRVLTVSEFSKRRIAERLDVDPARISVVPCGVDPVFGTVTGDAARASAAARTLGQDYVLTVGTLEPRKNLSWLLQAWSALARPTLTLAIAGAAGPQFARAALPPVASVRLLGAVDDETLAGLYAGARALVLPSRYEGFGLPALEAMACGAPVIAADAGALPEVTAGAALLVPPDDSAALMQAIGRVLDTPALAADLAARGRARAAQFSWDRSAAAVRELLDREAGRFSEMRGRFPDA